METDTQRLLHDAAARPRRGLDMEALQRRRARRRTRRRAAGVLGGVLLLIGVGVGIEGLGLTRSVDFAPTDQDHSAASPEAEPGWTTIADSPLAARHGAAAFKVDGEVLVFGGRATPVCPPGASCVPPEQPALSDGAAYDPSTDSWRRLADAPVPLDVAPGVVLGDVVYVLVAAPEGEPPDFLAYHAAQDRWERLPAPPARWLQLVALDGRIAGVHPTHELGTDADLLYDPAARSWTELPADPNAPSYDRGAVTIDGELVVLGLPHVDQPGAQPSLYHAAAYQPATNTWRRIPDAPPDRAVAGWGSSWFAINGLAVNPHLGSSDGGQTNRYDRAYPHGGTLGPRTGTWSHLPDAPAGPSEPGPHTDWIVGSTGELVADGWLFRPAAGLWTPIEGNPALADQGHTTVLLDEQLFVWGGGSYDGTVSADGWLWTPPPGSPGASAEGAVDPSDVSATSSPSPSTEPPVKCAPPPASAQVTAGPAGNEWVTTVGTGQDTVVDALVDVLEAAHIEQLRFEIQPAGVPGPVIGPSDPPGPPVVWWTVAGEALGPGSYDLAVSWDGTDQAGNPVAPGKYHLFAAVDARSVGEGQEPCGPEAGVLSSERSGLGYFEVSD